MFIVFEGVDGAGKTTQLKVLADRLVAAGVAVTVTREPASDCSTAKYAPCALP